MVRVIIFMLSVFLLTAQSFATDINAQQKALENALPEISQELMENTALDSTSSFGEKLLGIVQKAWERSKTQFTSSMRNVTLIIIIVLLCAISSSVFQGIAQRAAVLCGTAGILLVCVGDMRSMISTASETISEVHAFSKLLLPVMSGACFSSGLPTTSTALYSGSAIFMQILLTVLEKVLLPLVYAYIALSGADAALDSNTLERFGKFIGSTIKNVLKVIMLLFSAYLSLTGLISGRADSIALKAARLTVSTAVPIVGGMVSDASETVLVGAKILLNSAGVFGMLGALSIMILPFLSIGIQYLLLQIGTAISSLIGLKSHTRLLDAISSAMGYLLAITSCSTLMIFISCFCFMRVSSV